MIKIYTDGGCRPSNPGPGGFSIVAVFGDGSLATHAEAYHTTTNNRMELMAVIRAIQMYAPQYPLVIYTDSTYVSGIAYDLVRRSRTDLESKANPDLWLELQSLLFQYQEVKILWVKGHNGNRFNELADQIATEINRQDNKGRKPDVGYFQQKRGLC